MIKFWTFDVALVFGCVLTAALVLDCGGNAVLDFDGDAVPLAIDCTTFDFGCVLTTALVLDCPGVAFAADCTTVALVLDFPFAAGIGAWISDCVFTDALLFDAFFGCDLIVALLE
jgi:hypothetical protein